MPDHPPPRSDDVLSYLRDRNNWGRWGDDDQLGAINLITPEKRVQAAGLVKSGRSVSLSRDFPTIPGRHNPMPAQHFVRVMRQRRRRLLRHRLPRLRDDARRCALPRLGRARACGTAAIRAKEVTSNGARFGAIDNWRDGITTRGVLLDVPKLRGEPYVTHREARARLGARGDREGAGRDVEPGDALVVYSGRETWQAAQPRLERLPPAEPRPARVVPAVRARPRCRGARLGHDGRGAERVRHALDDARRHLRLRRRPRRQLARSSPSPRPAPRKAATSSCSRSRRSPSSAAPARP